MSLWETSGRLQSDVARELGVQPSMLRRWQKGLGANAGLPAFAAKPPLSASVSTMTSPANQASEIAKKLRDLELRSGQPARRGQRGTGYEYNLTESCHEERQRGERAEAAYKRLTEGWTKRGSRVSASASPEARR